MQLRHDLAFEHATSRSDVVEADKEAIVEFAKKIPSSNYIGATAGNVGLSLKEAAESVFGSIYPTKSMLEANRAAEESRKKNLKQNNLRRMCIAAVQQRRRRHVGRS